MVRDRFEDEEKRDELPLGLLGAVARQESGLSPCAVSSAGATGLMQLMPATAVQFGVGDRFDPWQSLQGGGQFLKQLLSRYNGDLRLALGAYNAGPAQVDYFGGLPPFPETQNYVESVMSRMKRITAVESPVKP
jgi:soluble lytic murein transglycosylase-like protein